MQCLKLVKYHGLRMITPFTKEVQQQEYKLETDHAMESIEYAEEYARLQVLEVEGFLLYLLFSFNYFKFWYFLYLFEFFGFVSFLWFVLRLIYYPINKTPIEAKMAPHN